jgi:hypothetical protein
MDVPMGFYTSHNEEDADVFIYNPEREAGAGRGRRRGAPPPPALTTPAADSALVSALGGRFLSSFMSF